MKTIDQEIDDLVKGLRKTLAKPNLSPEEVAWCQNRHIIIRRMFKLKQFLNANGYTHVNHVLGHRTPLIDAIGENNEEIFELLLRHPKIKVNQTNDLGQTATWISAAQGKLPFLKRLAKTKADFRKPDSGGSTPFFAAIKNKFYEAAAFVVHKITGFSIYEDNQYGQLPVHALAKSRKPQAELDKIFKFFNSNNVSLDACNDNMETPLMVAARFSNIEGVKALIDNGANVCAVNRDGVTFLELLRKRHHAEVLDYLAQKQMNANWYEDVKKVKEYGHVLGIGTFLQLGKKLGLGGVVNVPLGQNNQTAPVYTESWHRKESYRVLQEELRKHIDTEALAHSHFNAVYASVALANRLINSENRAAAINDGYAAYQANKPLILPVTIPGHGVGLAIYKDKLIYTDRFLTSGKKFNECTKIFQLNDTSEAAIRDLLSTFSVSSDEEVVMNKLHQYVDYDHPLLETGDKLQMHGTCSYTNPRSNIEGLLCVMQADQLNRTLQACKFPARRAYRDFLYKGRFRKAQQLMDELNAAEKSGDIAKANMYYDIAEGYIRGHKSRTKNEGTDRKNVIEIYQRLPSRFKRKFKSRNPDMANRLHRTLLYTKVRKLLPKSTRPVTQTLLHEILHQIKQQENLGKSPDLSEAILNTYQLAISAGHKTALKETHHLVKVLALDNTLPDIDFEQIFGTLNKPIVTAYHPHDHDHDQPVQMLEEALDKAIVEIPKQRHATRSIAPLIKERMRQFEEDSAEGPSSPTLAVLKAAALKRIERKKKVDNKSKK
ncbi:MAG: ankyrin repeat domain-containing protein [Candidatus Berkiella sp.]